MHNGTIRLSFVEVCPLLECPLSEVPLHLLFGG